MNTENTYFEDVRATIQRLIEPLMDEYRPYKSPVTWGFPTITKGTFDNDWTLSNSLEDQGDNIRYFLGQLAIAVEDYDIDTAVSLADDLVQLATSLDLPIKSTMFDIQEQLQLYGASSTELIYIPPEPKIQLLELSRSIDARFISMLRNSPNFLTEMNSSLFEELIAELFSNQGFEVQITAKTRDGGKDIIAFQNRMDIRLKYLIECKRYAQKRKVTLDVVQRLYGVKVAERANVGVVVTSSTFTKDAFSFAKTHEWDLHLKDSKDIISWLQMYK